MPQIPPLLIPAKFSAFSKQFPHLRKKFTQCNCKPKQTRKPQLAPTARWKTTGCILSPFALSATGPGHHPDVTHEETAAGGAAGLVVAQGRQGTLTDLSQLCTVGIVS